MTTEIEIAQMLFIQGIAVAILLGFVLGLMLHRPLNNLAYFAFRFIRRNLFRAKQKC